MKLDRLRQDIIAASLNDVELKKACQLILAKQKNTVGNSWFASCTDGCTISCAPAGCASTSCAGGVCTASATNS